MPKRTLLVTTLIVIVLSVSTNLCFAKAVNTNQKVVILCFDGVDGDMTSEFMAKGLLPNLSKLSQQGVFSNLETTNPPQTPVSWAAFTTGWHPGKTEIFDFLKRDEGSYLPSFSQITIISKQFLFGEKNPLFIGLGAGIIFFLISYILLRLITKKKKLSLLISILVFIIIAPSVYILVRAWVPIENTFVENNRKGTPFWDVLNLNGINTKVFNIPVTFPAAGEKNGHLLTGLGTPDITGSIGKPSYFTTSQSMIPSTGEFTITFTKLEPASDGVYYSFVQGPDRRKVTFLGDKKEEEKEDLKSLLYIDPSDERKKSPEYLFESNDVLLPEDKEQAVSIPIRLTVNKSDRSVTIELQGQKQTLKEGQWSDWYEMKFKLNPILSLWGIARFCLQEATPDLKLYLSPIHLHPEYSIIPVTYPKNWAGDLFEKYGLYKTLGWAVDTWSLQEQLIDEKSFLEDAYYTRHQNEIMMLDTIDDGDQSVQVHYFEYIDRIQHLFWRLIDEKHPYFDVEKAELFKKAILESYQDMDRVVGEAMKKIDSNTLLFVVSDHGFLSWRRAINYNTWLAQNGYIVQTQWDTRSMELEDLFGEKTENFWPNVDWSKTKAYALGIGNIYLNVLGREPNGIVTNEEYDKIRDEICKKMPELIDPETGIHPIVKVYKREEIWDEFDTKITPDLRVCTNEYYRVSWQSTLGNIPKDLFYDNKNNWSADHCSADPSMVQGIFFCNKKTSKKENPKLVDFFPTVLKLYGIDPASYRPSGVNLFE